MRLREFHYCWEWHLQSSPQALWPLLADTNRFNYDIGLPSVEQPGADAAVLSNARRRLRLLQLGIAVEWIEEPFEWMQPYRFGIVRRYQRGPVAEMRARAELTPQAEGGTHLRYQVWVRPQNILGLIAIPLQVGVLSRRSFNVTIQQYDQLALAGKLPLELPARVHFTPGGRQRLVQFCETLVAQGADHDLVTRLATLIERGDDNTLARLRPYALADYWGVSRSAVLELCLLATRAGLLDFRWDLLCPLCRGSQAHSSTLSDIEAHVHCDHCNIDFEVNFDRSVELTFRPNPSIRSISEQEFCIGGPGITPHIVIQQLLQPGERRTVMPLLEEGRYRLRALNWRGHQLLSVSAAGQTEVSLAIVGIGWPTDEPEVALSPQLTLENKTDREQLLILERMSWSDQAVTATEVTTRQAFRDLFANEALRPGERISVGNLTILFTDLRESTRLYRDIGDAPAFGLVMNHFDVLREIIAAEEGAIVKTIGDAVMAAFHRPASALRAALKAQHILLLPRDGMRPLYLKAGIHSGPCIAVTLNDRLDYFGSAVNIAARLVGMSTGDDVIISARVYHDPEVAEVLAEWSEQVHAAAVAATLKGFDTERFELWRMTRVALATSEGQRHQR